MKLFEKIFGKNHPYRIKIPASGKPGLPVLQHLSKQEQEFISKNALAAKKFLVAYRIAVRPVPFHPDNISAFLFRWFEKGTHENAVVSSDKISACMAAAWGEYLSVHMNMQWKVITDSFGTEMGLWYPKNEISVFPFQSMTKAINTRDYRLPSEITKKTAIIMAHR